MSDATLGGGGVASGSAGGAGGVAAGAGLVTEGGAAAGGVEAQPTDARVKVVRAMKRVMGPAEWSERFTV